jgi:hypothetical protein
MVYLVVIGFLGMATVAASVLKDNKKQKDYKIPSKKKYI